MSDGLWIALFRYSSNLSKKEDKLVLFNEVALARLVASASVKKVEEIS